MSTANQKKYYRKRQNLSQEFDRIIEQDDTQNEEGFKVLNNGIDELKRMESGLNEELENERAEAYLTRISSKRLGPVYA